MVVERLWIAFQVRRHHRWQPCSAVSKRSGCLLAAPTSPAAMLKAMQGLEERPRVGALPEDEV